MNFNQLVFRNVIRNGREYFTYFISSLFSVMVFFVFSLLYFHPDLGDQLRGSSDGMTEMASFGISVAEVVIAIMSFIFLWYAFNAFLKTRKQQLSIYLTLGMSEKKLRKMIISENLVLGFGSILTGTITGIVFSKLILLISQNILALEEGLSFYFPVKAIALTWLVYGIIFVFISIMTIFKLRKLGFAEMKFGHDEIVAEPKTSVFMTILGLILIALGYSLAFLFAFGASGYISIDVGLGVLLACVLITIGGTFLFFKYASVRLFYSLKQKNIFFKNGNMLTISNLMQRMRSNATMYFMISIVGAVAFVGIGVSKAISGYEFGSTQGDSFAVVYEQGYGEATKESKKQHQEAITTIEQMIRDRDYQLLSIELDPVEIWLEEKNSDLLNFINVINESTFNEVMTFMDKETVTIKNNEDILKLVGTNSEMQAVKAKKLTKVSIPSEIVYFNDNEKEERYPINLTYSDTQLSISSRDNLAVVTDTKYEELKKRNVYDYNKIHVFHFNEWQTDKQLNDEIVKYLINKQEENIKKTEKYYESIDKDLEEELTEKEIEEIMKLEAKGIRFSSMYRTWIDTKQKNGTILLISVLLGSVFFTFSCSIIYFKLFGELEKDGKYHRSLYILGVPEKRRRKMVTTEMLIMFFIPFIISTTHFIAAMSALKILIELPVYQYVFQILSVYIFFQLVFFFICRRQYLTNLNKYAENIKR